MAVEMRNQRIVVIELNMQSVQQLETVPGSEAQYCFYSATKSPRLRDPSRTRLLRNGRNKNT